ncbi:MAG: hypothetical protein A2V81_01615 [Candidatus Abawacabacteria bacterium RBG_16_42_10]|uniref:GIY-YIG domain-containing protein n=1 Tax=Candidatus Abawacabacteria bacterium RBG_16_42_10 TaxID=1817814 RepID=A0A1F4XKN2_9BACT|nr:MAG: hypothetical protein A2V81_01615 [Candidatus Abawacabacteria bacterium RBG_16_42_10]
MYVYITASKTRVIYVGVTNNLLNRIYQHKEGITPGFTQKYKCNRLVYYECHDSPDKAISREKQIKGMSRTKKIYLIEKTNPLWFDLTEWEEWEEWLRLDND